MLTAATNAPADETSIYATAFFGDASLLNTLTLTFPTNINNFFMYVYNGQTYTETFTISDNLGNFAVESIAPNFNSGNALINFPTTGGVVSITTTDPNWDFVIDNIAFNTNTPPPPPGSTPEPATLMLFGSGLVGIAAKLRRRLI